MLTRQEGLWKFWAITATEVGKSGVTGHLSFESTHGNSVKTRTKYERKMQVNLNTLLHQYRRRGFEFPIEQVTSIGKRLAVEELRVRS
jgi:hypothetical protein